MAISIDDLASNSGFTLNEKGKVTLPPRPAPGGAPLHDRQLRRPHRRAAARVRRAAPGEVRRAGATDRRDRRPPRDVALRRPGAAQRRVQRRRRPARRASTASTRPASTRCAGARGTSRARIHDMDLNGVYASLNFPSFLPGLRRASASSSSPTTPSSRSRASRAWNDWNLEEWAGHTPGRIIPLQIPYVLDPEVGAEEIRRNAERGFKAITFSEGPAPPRAARRCTPTTGIRSCARARRPAPSCACTSARRARRRRPRPTPRATRSACCSSATRCSPRSTGSTRRSRCASPT